MALTIKNPEVERLAAEVARLTGETKTQAIRVALEERRSRLGSGVDRDARRSRAPATAWKSEIWARRSAGAARHSRTTRVRDDAILGYGPDGLPE